MMVNNMEYWASKQKKKLNDATTIVASGKQINKPSDNPAAAGQILEDRATIAKYDQYEANILQTETWIETNNTTLDLVNTLLQDAQEIIVSLSSADEGASEDYATELESIYDQIMSYANSMYGSGYMYSGNQSDTAPFSNSVDVSGGTASNILFDLAGAASDMTIEITDSTGTVARTLTATSGVGGTNTITWDGRDDGGNTLADGSYTFTVTAANGSDAVAAYPSYRGDEGGKKIITGQNSVVTIDNNGGSIFSDALCTLSVVITALNNDADLPSDLTNSLQAAIDGITSEQVTLANINAQLENSGDRLTQLTTYINGRISDLEVGDTTLAATELTAQETDYETTLKAVADVLQMPKLADYLS